mmetsp:Transcript_6591/g.20500  ORF Transcript_6591/g.20500 Transcript_6591/m.20500 type:complete len:627 (+) Transcript_6591:613-2493(+)
MLSESSVRWAKNLSPMPSSRVKPDSPLAKARSFSRVMLPSVPALICSKSCSGDLLSALMRSRMAATIWDRSASSSAYCFRAERSLAALAAARALSSTPCDWAAWDLSLPASSFLKGLSSGKSSASASKAATSARALSSISFTGFVAASDSAATSLSRSAESSLGGVLMASGLAMSSTLAAASAASPRGLARASSAFRSSSLLSSTSARLFSSSIFRRRSFSSSSARFSRALTSDLAMATMERRRWNLSKGTPSSVASALMILSRCSSPGANSYSALAKAATSSLFSLPSASASYLSKRSFCSFCFFRAAALRPALSLVVFTASLSFSSDRRQIASLLKRGLSSVRSLLRASSELPISARLSTRALDVASSLARVSSTAFSVVDAASSIASGDVSSAASTVGLAASLASARRCSAAATSSAASLARRSTRSTSSLFRCSSSAFFFSSARRFSEIWSTRSWAWSMAFSASCRTFSACEPIFSSCSDCVLSSSCRSSSKLSGVAMRTRWMTLRTMRAAACSVRLASSSSRFRRSSVCRRCISSSRSCCRRLMSSSRFFRSASFWAISTSCLCLRWSTMPPGGCAAQGCAGMTLGPVLGPMRSRRDSSTGPSQGTFQPLVGGRGEFLLTL